jgi:hypothetical protein
MDDILDSSVEDLIDKGKRFTIVKEDEVEVDTYDQ